MMSSKQNNADRFLGFGEVYENARPKVPKYLVEIICRYLGKAPELVVDMGCGTGLSTEVWQEVCGRVIGIEPSDDMRNIAEKKSTEKMSFIKAFSDDTGLESDCADVVVCSQSFHWMEPAATLKEVDRILKKGGIFATVDCDWPPVAKWEAESAYMKLYGRVLEIESQVPDIKDTFTRYPKDKHLENMAKSGYFRYTRELLFCSSEKCTRERFRNIILSQGSTQTILKKHPELIEKQLEEFYNVINSVFDTEPFDIEFSYRMRIGVK
ncbi:MAG: methyltransferase domain-containing protein [Oscillospiraceae bacterium]|nr:methyltransferase domain-containing protein [Oscillospiraceae bacterium]